MGSYFCVIYLVSAMICLVVLTYPLSPKYIMVAQHPAMRAPGRLPEDKSAKEDTVFMHTDSDVYPAQ